MELYVFPWTVEGIEWGGNVLELGPGYGVATSLLLPRCEHLTCVELDRELAANLTKRMEHSTKVTVLRGDASSMQFSNSTFDATVCFMMLHHVTPVTVQDRLFSEVIRVLKPGGIFAGADSPQSFVLRILHMFDRVSMIDSSTLADRLQAAGFENIRVSVSRYAFRFSARKPKDRYLPGSSSVNTACSENEWNAVMA